MRSQNTATYVWSAIFLLLVLSIIAFPSEAYKAALEGLKLWLNVVFPALLPFFICIEILIGLGVVSLLGAMFKGFMHPVFNVPGEASFAFFMSIASGYPVGSKIVSDLRSNNICSQVEGQRMLNLCSTSGPLFIIGAVATGILGNPRLGFLLAVSHYMSAITVGLFMRFYRKDIRSHWSCIQNNPLKEMLEYKAKDGRTMGVLLGDSVKNGVNLIMLIGGFIILFSVISSILKLTGILPAVSKLICSVLPFLSLDEKLVSSLIIGILEVTNGIKECAALDVQPLKSLVAISFMIGFGGLSVNAQVLSLIAATDLKFGLYLIIKAFQGVISAAYTMLLFGTFDTLQVMKQINVFDAAYSVKGNFSWFQIFCNSSINLMFMMIFLALFGLAASIKPKTAKKTRQLL
ncbi:MAG: sporulation integral membrane protein YlbJ [Bacillota bacterium]